MPNGPQEQGTPEQLARVAKIRAALKGPVVVGPAEEIERQGRILQDSLDTLELATGGGIVASQEDIDAAGAQGKTVVKAEDAAWAARRGLEAYRALVALGAAEPNPDVEKYLVTADEALWKYADMPLENVYPEMLILDWYGLKALSALAGVAARFLGGVTARVVAKIGLKAVFPRVAGAVVGGAKITGGLVAITGAPAVLRPFGITIPGIGWLAALPMTGLAALQSAAGKKPFAEEFTAHLVALFGPGGEGVRAPESSSKDILRRLHLSSGNAAVDFLPELAVDLVIMALVGGASQAGKRLAPRIEARMARLPVALQGELRATAERLALGVKMSLGDLQSEFPLGLTIKESSYLSELIEYEGAIRTRASVLGELRGRGISEPAILALVKSKKAVSPAPPSLVPQGPKVPLGKPLPSTGASFTELLAQSDRVQKLIDARHNVLDQRGIPFAQQASEPQLAALYEERVGYDTAAATKAYEGARRIILNEIKGFPEESLYASLDGILRERYSLTAAPPGTYLMSKYTGESLSNPNTVENVGRDIAKLMFAKEYPNADFWVTTTSNVSGMSRKAQEALLARAMEKAQRVHAAIRRLLTGEFEPSPPALPPRPPLGKPLPTTTGRVEKVVSERPGERPKGVPAGPTPTKGGTPIDRGRNMLVFEEPSRTPGSLGRAWDWFMRAWKDKFRPIEQFEKAAGKQIGEEVAAGESPFQVASAMSHASRGKAETWIMDKTIDFDGNVTGKGLAEILEPVKGKERDAILYAYAKHALERWKQGKNPGISWDDATAVIKQMQRPAFDKFATEFAAYNERLADYAIAGGALSPDVAAAFREVYESYMPLYRAMGEYARGIRGGRGFGDLPKLYKKAVGGEQQVIDPLASTIQRTQTIISWADRARIGGLIADLIDRAGGSIEGWGRRVEVPRKPTAAELKAALSDFEKLGGNTKDLSPAQLDKLLTFWVTRVYGLPEQNTVRFFKNGELQVYELDPVLYESVKMLDAAKLPLWLQLTLGGPRNLTVLGATGLRASFGLVTNFLRDPTTYFIQSEYGGKLPNPFRPLIETFRQGASKLGMPDTKLGDLWRRLGGEQSVWFNVDLPKAMKTAGDMVRQGRTPATWVKIVLKGGFVVYRETINIPEAGPRRTEFKDAYEAEFARTGDARSATIAALNAARRVTVPFTRAGSIGQYVNQIIPFFNPSLQGLFTFADVIRNNPKQVAARGAAMAALTLALWWRNKDDKEIQALPDYDKYGFWHYRIGDTIWRVPRPFEPGYIFAAMPEATAQLAYDHDRKAFVAAFGQSLAAAAPPIMPAGASTLLEEWANKSLFTGRPIVPQGQLERLPPSQQYSRYTTEIAKWLGAKLGVSPARIEHELSGWTGGLGLDIVQAVDNIFAGKPRPFELANLPFISRIVSRSPWVGKFYDTMDEAREEAARLGGKTYRLKALENVADLLRDLRKKELAVDASGATKEQKVAQLTRIRDMIESLARTAVGNQESPTVIPPKVKAPKPPKVPSLPGHMPIPTGPVSYNPHKPMPQPK